MKRILNKIFPRGTKRRIFILSGYIILKYPLLIIKCLCSKKLLDCYNYIKLKDWFGLESWLRQNFVLTRRIGLLKKIHYKIRSLFLNNRSFIDTENINRHDVIFSPIINCDFQFQKLQHLTTKFAQKGHRVFYIKIESEYLNSYFHRKISNNIYEVNLPISKLSIAHRININKDFDLTFAAINKIFKDFSIKESIAIVESPFWIPIVQYLKNRFDTKIIFHYPDKFPNFKYTHLNSNIDNLEQQLIKISDYCITTSLKLYKKLKNQYNNVALKRIEFAKANDWENRFSEINRIIKSIYPLVNIIVVTFNNFSYTKLCIESIYAKTAYPNFQLIIVDNNSTDNTVQYLKMIQPKYENLKIILNLENKGFAAANNIGIRESNGKFIILLNNDTIVTRGWIGNLLKHLQNPEIGMVGPVTNFAANEAKIKVNYNTQSLLNLDYFAEFYTTKNNDKSFEIKMLAFFCVALRRDTIEKIGLLDEIFSIGTFEDDDYALRVKQAGLKVICAQDVFIHHFGSVSFGKLELVKQQKIFDENREKYENKWNIKWQPHKSRKNVK